MQLEITINDIRSIILSISNHLKFLCEKKIVRICEYFYDLSLVQDNMEKDKETLLFEYINMFFVDPVRRKIESAVSIKEHKALLEELKFIVEEIKILVQEYYEIKKKQEEEYNKLTQLSVEKAFEMRNRTLF